MLEKEISFRLPWKVICALACKALILGMSFDDVCTQAIKEGLERKPMGEA